MAKIIGVRGLGWTDMQKTVKGSRGETLGYITEHSDRRTIYDAAGAMLGYYNKNTDKTFDRSGAMVGNGDQLTRLLKD